jgi:UDP-N-acetylmuramate dehydrogenase
MQLNLVGLQTNVSLAPYTTYQIGGSAELFVVVRSAAELAKAVVEARRAQASYFILGSGANILVSDQGVRGLVILNRANHWSMTGTQLTAESGATIADLIKITKDRGLSGFEHFAGIPSSVGGAIWQNLHFLSPDRQSTVFIGEIVERATVIDVSKLPTSPVNRTSDTSMVGNLRQVVNQDFFNFGYDDSRLHYESILVLDVTFRLFPKPPAEIQRLIDANLAWRQAKQPQLDEFASCGSVFKKIEGVGAGRLIDQAGLKGTTVGRVQVSLKHANYLVNLGGATATDVRQLIEQIQREVKEKTGYHLEPEVRFVGEW